MKSAICLFCVNILLNIVTSVSGVCIAQTRNESSKIADDNSWYTPTIFNRSHISDCGCDKKYTCVRKCCDEDYIIGDEGTCEYNRSVQFAVPIFKYGNVIIDDEYMVDFRYVSGINECLLDDDDDYYEASFEDFFIQKDGRLWLSSINTYFTHDQYCLEYDEVRGPLALICIVDYNLQALVISERLTVIGMIISLPFLFITFVIYAILPLRNLHGKSLMCYVFTLFMTYLINVIIHLNPNSEHFTAIICRTIAMLYYYFFESSFFWMNVMSIDIYLTFSGARGYTGNKKRTERKRFLWYSLYCWICPIFLVVIVLTLSELVKPNRWYNPGITDQQCWLNDGIPLFVFFYLPMTVLIISNIVLFAITACKIRQVQQDTAVLRSGDNKTSKTEDDKIRFSVYVKLFLAMGINWSVEIISWAVDWHVEHVPPAVWYITEFCNAVFGVFIFLIFVFKKNIWILLKKRYYKCRSTAIPESEAATSATGQTVVSK